MADLLMIALKVSLVIFMAGNLLEVGLRLTIMVIFVLLATEWFGRPVRIDEPGPGGRGHDGHQERTATFVVRASGPETRIPSGRPLIADRPVLHGSRDGVACSDQILTLL